MIKYNCEMNLYVRLRAKTIWPIFKTEGLSKQGSKFCDLEKMGKMCIHLFRMVIS